MRTRRLSPAEVQVAVREYLARRGEHVVRPKLYATGLMAPATLAYWEVETEACEPHELKLPTPGPSGVHTVQTLFEMPEADG